MLIERILHWSRVQPDKAALIANGRAMNYREFADAIESTIDSLRIRKLPEAGTVLVWSADRVQSWLHILALRQLGLSPLTPMPGINPADLGIDKPALVLTFTWRKFLKEFTRNIFSGVRVLGLPRQPRCSADRSRVDRPVLAKQVGDMLLLSSGTTGRYKVIVVPGSDIESAIDSVCTSYRLNQDTIFNFHTLGPWTGMGGRVLPSVWACGGTVIFDTTEDRLHRIFHHGTNTTFIVPTDTEKVIEGFPPCSPCLIYMGGGFLSARKAAKLKALPQCTTVFGFGATEASGLLLEKKLEPGLDDAEHWLEPVEGRRLEVVDDEDRTCADGVEGWLRVQLQPGDSVGYLADAATTAKAFRAGHYYTGDLATRAGLGRIRISGRSADVVVLRSQKISATTIESTVRSALGLESVCAFSGLGENGEEELAIALELDESPDAESLKQLEARLPAFDSIRWVCLPAFPRTDTGLGKIKRNVLRSLIFPLTG